MTPPASSWPLIYAIMLLISEDTGYTSASLSFRFAVSNHQLLFKHVHRTVQVTECSNVQIADTVNELSFDGNTISDVDIAAASAEIPTWLKFDNTL